MTTNLTRGNIIGVDLDSTLYCFLSAFNRSALDLHGVEGPVPHDVTEWNAIEPFFDDFRDMLQCFEHAYSLENVELNVPYAEAKESLERLAGLGYEIEYFTDRPDTSASATEAWLEHWDFPSRHNLNVCADKREVLRARNMELATLIDDRPRTLVFARYELGMENVYSLKHSYNRNFSDIPGIHLADTWAGLEDLILNTLPLPTGARA
jgi:hypothetical protein